MLDHCERVRQRDVILTAFMIAFMLFFLVLPPIHSSAADPEESSGGYKSWVRDTGAYTINADDFEDISEAHAKDEAAGRLAEQNPNSFETMISYALVNVGNSIDKALRSDNQFLDASVTGLILGNIVGGGKSMFVFDLRQDNLFGIVSSYIYVATRAVVIVLIVILAVWGVSKSVWTSDAVAFAGIKEALFSGLLALVFIYAMPLIIDWACTARDFLSVEIFTRFIQATFYSSEATSEQGIQVALDMSELYYRTYTECPTLMNALVFDMVCLLPLFFLWNYLKIAIQTTLLFGTFPVFALASVSDKKTVSQWLAVMITNIFIPPIDLALVSVPAFVMKSFYLNKSLWTEQEIHDHYVMGVSAAGGVPTGEYELVFAAPLSRAIIMCALFASIIPARNMLLAMLGNRFGAASSKGSLGAALGMGVAAARTVGGLFHGSENTKSGDGNGGNGGPAPTGSEVKGSNEEAGDRLSDMSRDLTDIPSANSGQKNGPDVEDMRDADRDREFENRDYNDNNSQNDTEEARFDPLNDFGQHDNRYDEASEEALRLADTVDNNGNGEMPEEAEITALGASEGSTSVGESYYTPAGSEEAASSEDMGGNGSASDDYSSNTYSAGADTTSGYQEYANHGDIPDAQSLADEAIADSTVTAQNIGDASRLDTQFRSSNPEIGGMETWSQEYSALSDAIDNRFGGQGLANDKGDAEKTRADEAKTSREIAQGRMANLATIDNLRDKQKGFSARGMELDRDLSRIEHENRGHRDTIKSANADKQALSNMQSARANLARIDKALAKSEENHLTRDEISGLKRERGDAENVYHQRIAEVSQRYGVNASDVQKWNNTNIDSFNSQSDKKIATANEAIEKNENYMKDLREEKSANESASKIVGVEIGRRENIEKKFAQIDESRGMSSKTYENHKEFADSLKHDARVIQTSSWRRLAQSDTQGKMTPMERRDLERTLQKQETLRKAAATTGKYAAGVAAAAAGVAVGSAAVMVSSIGGDEAMQDVANVAGQVTNDASKLGSKAGNALGNLFGKGMEEASNIRKRPKKD